MKLFSAFPSQKNVILNIATGYQIWDVFFSDFFFPENNSSSIVILKEEILALIAITTTVENYENVTECSSLLVIFVFKSIFFKKIIYICEKKMKDLS